MSSNSLSHPSAQRALAALAKAGVTVRIRSAAYLLQRVRERLIGRLVVGPVSCLEAPDWRWQDVGPDPYVYGGSRPNLSAAHNRRRTAWLAANSARRIEGEFRRAAKDPLFRRRAVAARKAEIRRLNALRGVHGGGHDALMLLAASRVQDAEGWRRDAEHYDALCGQLRRLGAKKIPELFGGPRQNRDYAIVSFAYAVAEAHGLKICRRGKNWKVLCAAYNESRHNAGYTEWRNGRAVAYHRASNTTVGRSFATVSNDGRRIEFSFIEDAKRVFDLPVGYIAGIDELGLWVQREGSRYAFHPLASDLLGGVETLVHAVDADRVEKRAADAAESAPAYVAEGFGVFLADSVRGGNCEAGSRAFARIASIDTGNALPVEELVKLADRFPSYREYILRAVNAAAKRNAVAMERGYSFLMEVRG